MLDCFARYFGPEAKSQVRDYVDKSWAKDPWSRGCYVGFTPPGVLVGYRNAIRAPVRAAGSERTSPAIQRTAPAESTTSAVESGPVPGGRN